MVMIRLEVKEDAKSVKNCFMCLRLESFALNVPEWSQKNKRLLKFITPNHHNLIWEME
jgi:hypothetical protein